MTPRIKLLSVQPRRSRVAVAALLAPLSHRPGARARSADGADPALAALWHVVCTIPRGRVATYGAVARAAGLPGHARQAGFALRVAPATLHLPWHRVVGAGGRIVFPPGSREHREQARRLRAEGVVVRDGRVRGAALTGLEEL